MSTGTKNSPDQHHTRTLGTKYKKRSKKTGLPPGTMVHIGSESREKVHITSILYSEEFIRETEIKKPEEINIPDKGVLWLNVDGLHEIETIGLIGKKFEIHPLILEDIVNTTQRPKIEDLGQNLYIVFKILEYDTQTDEITPEQISLILGENYVITFQERPRDPFDPIRLRLRSNQGRLRKEGGDYLAYALMDIVVDHYFVVLDQMADKIESLEESLVSNPNRQLLADIHKLKMDMIFIRKGVWPLREVIKRMELGEFPFVKESTYPYLRDIYDHIVHAGETLETYREVISGMLDIYLSGISNRLNEIMKVLTMLATLFIPLTFMTGWYGMNFKDMPELSWKWGYPAFICLVASSAALMLFYFRIKKWF